MKKNDKRKMWCVYPGREARRYPWFVPIFCLTQESAYAERAKYEQVTGFEWKIREPIEA